MITAEALKAICPATKLDRLALFVEPLNSAMLEFEINTPDREAMFVAQCAHETMAFNTTKELWGPTDAQRKYEGRLDLGNVESGDGFRFRGRGLIQTTGRENYRLCGEAFGVDLIANPELLELPELACRSAGLFWQTHGCNALADKGDLLRVTKKINGGTNGYAERQQYLNRAQRVIA